MNCAEVQQVLPEIIDGSSNIPEYQSHVKSCPDCSELVADLELIVRESRQLSEADEPAPRLWVKIAAELRSEGVIREPEAAPGRPVLVATRKPGWNAWWAVPVAAAVVAAGSYVIKPRPAAPVANQTPPPAVVSPEKTPAPTVTATNAAKPVATPQKITDVAQPDEAVNPAPLMTAGTADQQIMDGVSPELRPAYQRQLDAVNSYIRDADAYVRQNPGDEDARQHLMEAYQQREMLYQMALDHVQ